MGFGPYSDPLRVQTLGWSSSTPTEAHSGNEDDSMIILVAIIVGVLLVIVVVGGICLWHR